MLETISSASWLLTPLEWLKSAGVGLLYASSYNKEEEDLVARRAEIEEQEKEFHDFVRENIICLQLFIALYLFSYWLISRYKERTDSDSLYVAEEDYSVYRISVWMCTFSLAGSLGSILLLPFSILGAELLQRFPSSYYLQWLSWSLMHTLWNYVFFLSNLSLFVLLPFAYFFIESQGFNKKKNGVLQRAYETALVCIILVLVLLSLADLIYTLVVSSGGGEKGEKFVFGLSFLNVPLLYSFVSLVGVVLLLVSTPLGFTKMFAIVSDLAQARPPAPTDDVSLERLDLFCQKQRRGRAGSTPMSPIPNGLDYGAPMTPTTSAVRSYANGYGSGQSSRNGTFSNGYGGLNSSNPWNTSNGYSSSVLTRSQTRKRSNTNPLDRGDSADTDSSGVDVFFTSSSSSASSSSSSPLSSSPLSTSSSGSMPLRQKSLRWYQHVLHSLKYTVAIVVLIALTALSVLLVLINTLKLSLGYRALPEYAQYIEVNSRHVFGMFGVFLEIVIIVYIMVTSVVGVYSMPLLRNIRPKRGKTTMTAVIINCSTIVVLTSALPVLASTLGLTTFDLLGLYSSLRWLTNFKLVLTYNLLFAVVTTTVLVNKMTSPMRQHFMKTLRELRFWRQPTVAAAGDEKED